MPADLGSEFSGSSFGSTHKRHNILRENSLIGLDESARKAVISGCDTSQYQLDIDK